MTDHALALALAACVTQELELRRYLGTLTNAEDVPERDRALVGLRQTIALKKAYEAWVLVRTVRAAQQTTARKVG